MYYPLVYSPKGTTARVGSDQNQEPGNLSRSLTAVAGMQVLELESAVSRVHWYIDWKPEWEQKGKNSHWSINRRDRHAKKRV